MGGLWHGNEPTKTIGVATVVHRSWKDQPWLIFVADQLNAQEHPKGQANSEFASERAWQSLNKPLNDERDANGHKQRVALHRDHASNLGESDGGKQSSELRIRVSFKCKPVATWSKCWEIS